MANKYYAIKKGIDSKTNKVVSNIIVNSWNECLSYVKGAKGAVYKSFATMEEVDKYLNSDSALKKGVDKYPLMIPHIYVDGSYNAATSNFGYGLVVIDNNIIIHASYGGGCNEECNQRQVNGELRAAVEGIEYAVGNNYKEVVVFYDYEGVCQHATGAWERNTDLSKEYYETINNLKAKGNLKIIFVKVDSHTDDLYNDIADELAKTGAGVSIDRVVDKAIKNTSIKVSSNNVKNVLIRIIEKNEEKIICENHFISDDNSMSEIKTNYIICNEDKLYVSGDVSDEVRTNNILSIITHIKNLDKKDRDRYLKSLEVDIKDEVIVTLVDEVK